MTLASSQNDASEAPSTRRSDDLQLIGSQAHRMIGELLLAGHRRPNVLLLRRHVAQHGLLSMYSGAPKQAAKQMLLSAASSYFRFFVPDDSWSFAGLEVSLAACRADLVWSGAEGVVIDEIKTGRLAARFERDALTQQVERLLAAGDAEYGDRLVGVRALVLAAPATSFWARPDGRTEPLDWELR